VSARSARSSAPSFASRSGAELCRGLKYDLDEYLAGRGAFVPVRSLGAIVASGRYDPSVEEDRLAMQDSAQQGPGSKACEANAFGDASALTAARFVLTAPRRLAWLGRRDAACR